MLRTKTKQINNIPPNVKLKGSPTIINIIPNNNNVMNQKYFLKNNILQRSNKFLSIPERQRIIREINESKNQLNFHINLYEPLKSENFAKKDSLDNKNLLYIKKTKSDLNFLDKELHKHNNNKIIKNSRNANNGNFKNIKFTDNRQFVNQAIKEYYRKIDSSFKSYLNTLNNKSNDKISSQNSFNNYNFSFFSSCKNKISNSNSKFSNNNSNSHISKNKDKSLGTNEIYKKPNLSKIYSKVNINSITEENKNPNRINNININLDKLNFVGSARKEIINYAKLINKNNTNKNNGSTRIIFNKINNYNTTTFRNNSKNQNLNLKNSNNNKEFLVKNNSSINFLNKINNFKRKNETNYLKNKEQNKYNNNLIERNYQLDIIRTNCFEENINKIINKNIKTENNINSKQNNILKYNNNLLSNDYNLNLNLNIKYTKKNIKSPSSIQSKKRQFKNNFINNELPKIISDNDLVSMISPYESLNNAQNNNSNQNNGENIININRNDNRYNYNDIENYDINNNIFKDKDEFIKFNYIPNKINDFKNRELKNEKINKSLTFSFEESPKKDDRKNKSFSYLITDTKNESNNNYIYKYGRYHYKYKKISPLYDNKYKLKYNYISHYKNKSLLTRDIIFPLEKNRNKSYYNSDDDIMNSNNNSSNNIFSENNNKSFDFNLFNNNRNNNIFNIKSPMKNYYFNYFTNKINNDFLDDKKFSKIENELFKKKNIFSNNKNNGKVIEINDSFNFSNRKASPLNSIMKSYDPLKIKSNIEKLNSILDYNKDKNNKKSERNNIYLKTDISIEKHSPKVLKLNINQMETKNKMTEIFENIENKNNDINKNSETDSYVKKEDKLKNKDITKITKENKENEINEKIDKNNSEIEYKNNKDNENKIENINLLSEISNDKNKKEEGISFNISEIILKDNFINDNSKTKSCITKIESKNEEGKGNEIKNNEKINNINNNDNINNNNEIIPIETKDINIKDDEKGQNGNDINNINNINKSNIINNNENDIINNLEEPIKKDYINNKLKFPISLDILEYINIITPKNYFTIKNNILNLIINNEQDNETLFIDILYPIAINQIKYQPVYAKLCKDLDKYFNKKEKTKSIIRTQLMKYCKTNFKKIKTCLENINDIVEDIKFIGELINVQMVSKKVGLQCLNHLINKFNQYNTDEKLMNKKEEKYLYLNCIINLLNKFATCVNCYQKEKIRQDELVLFEKEIKKNMDIIKDIMNDKANNDMPSKIRLHLLALINKSMNNWEISIFEEYKDKLFSSLNEDINNDSTRNINIIDDKSDTSNINNNIIEFDMKDNFFNFDKSEDKRNNNKNKQYKSVSPINNNINLNMNSNTNVNRRKQRHNSNLSNVSLHSKSSKNSINYSKKFENNLLSFRNHMEKYNKSDSFRKWNDIDNLFLNKKIYKNEIFKSIIEACKYFIKKKDDIYYVDIYIKIIFEYYYTYLNINDLNDIVNTMLEELGYLSNEILQKEENKFLLDIWIIIIYYLLQNKIMTMNDFNFFCKGFSKEIKTNIFTILNGVCNYNSENKKFYLKELKNTKFYNINKKISSDVFQDISF